MTFKGICLAATLASVAAMSTASAVTIYGLGTNNHLYRFESDNPAVAADLGAISVPGIVDIDFHAANGALYGMTSTGVTYGISLTDAAATLLITPTTSLSGVRDFDFNPVADRIRVSADGNANYRLVPDVITAPSVSASVGTVVNDGLFSGAPSGVTVVSNAYTNAFDTPVSGGVHTTTLYSIGSDGVLYINSTAAGAPMGSFGLMTPVGASGVAFTPGVEVGFDITADNQAFANVGSSFYSVNLANGAFTPVGNANAPLSSLAAIPEPSVAILGAFAGLALLRRQRRN